MQAVRNQATAEAVLGVRNYGASFVPWVAAFGEEEANFALVI